MKIIIAMNVFLYIQCSCVRSEEKFFLEPVSVDPRLQWEESGASDCCEKCWGGPRCLLPALGLMRLLAGTTSRDAGLRLFRWREKWTSLMRKSWESLSVVWQLSKINIESQDLFSLWHFYSLLHKFMYDLVIYKHF